MHTREELIAKLWFSRNHELPRSVQRTISSTRFAWRQNSSFPSCCTTLWCWFWKNLFHHNSDDSACEKCDLFSSNCILCLNLEIQLFGSAANMWYSDLSFIRFYNTVIKGKIILFNHTVGLSSPKSKVSYFFPNFNTSLGWAVPS